MPRTIPSGACRLPANAQADQAYTAIGQEFIQDTPLQNAMIAAGVANGGVIMTPRLMSSISDMVATESGGVA